MEDTKQYYKQGFIVVILLLFSSLMVTCNLLFKSNKKVKQSIELVNSLSDTLKLREKEDSSQVATISLLETQSSKDFINIQTKDEEIKRLQNLVKEYKNKIPKGGTATIVTAQTSIDKTSPTIINSRDTIKVDSLVYVYPEYKSNVGLGKWITGSVIANKDSTNLNLLVDNEYDIVIGETGNFWTWNKKPFVELTNHNPYTKTKTLRTYKVSTPKKRRVGIGFFAGYGMTIQLNPVWRPVMGVALQYNIIEF